MKLFEQRKNVRSPTKNAAIWLNVEGNKWPFGYTRLADNPEIQAAIQRVADMVSSMTIHLMENAKDGDKRIKNELSRKVDITPCRYITRKAWVEKIVKDMLVGGNSFSLPHFSGQMLDDIEPIPSSSVSIMDEEPYGYYVSIRGMRFAHDEVLHFVHNPDPDKPWRGRGHEVQLSGVAKQIGQARSASNSVMKHPGPSLIIMVDGLTEEFATKEGRDKLQNQYIGDSEAGKPWMIPAETFSVEQIKPLSINDLAIPDSITLDKRTAASIIGVPPFVVGVGDFDADAHNDFVRSRVLPIAREIEQELTRKLLLSPNLYFRMNPRSLYAYSITELTEVSCNLVDRAIIDRNEARDALSYNPRDGLSELAILENYIPYAKIGDQNKLKGGDFSGKTEQPEE